MNERTEIHKNKGVNPNFSFLVTEWDKWRVLVLQGGARCFIEDTLVNTPNGYVPIQDIRQGDVVYSISESSININKVSNIFTYSGLQIKHKMVKFVFNNYNIQCTYEHRFRINGKWLKAIDIAKRRMEGIGGEICSFDKGKISNIREIQGKNELCSRVNESSQRQRGIPKNINVWANSKDAPSNSYCFYSQSGEKGDSKPQKRDKIRQSCGELRVDNAQREFRPRSKEWICSEEQGATKWLINNNRGHSKTDKITTSDTKKGIIREVQSENLYDKGYSSWKDLELGSIIDVELLEYSGDVYDLEVENDHTYLVSRENIVSHNSGKTISVVDFIISLCQEYTGLTISVVRETLPSLKASILRDFRDRMLFFGFWSDLNFNKTELEYKFNGNLVEFFSVDNEQKVRGRKRQVLVMNEGNEITKDKYIQLMLRTEGIAIIDFNPSMPQHYIYDDIMTREDCAFLVTTYLDNPHLPEEIVREIELLKESDPMAWKVYGCGERGEDRAGLVYPMWAQTDTIPNHLPSWYGLDWGFANDPTAIVRLSYDKPNRIIYADEVAYQRGLYNNEISRIIKQDIWGRSYHIDEGIEVKNSNIYVGNNIISLQEYLENPVTLLELLGDKKYLESEIKNIAKYFYPIYCDSTEVKSIGELRQYGISAYPAIKGGGSVKAQIQYLYNFRILYRGENIGKERLMYRWKERKGTDEFENVPIDANNHLMDAIRYGAYTHISRS